ncbi:DUF3991 and TOPRIM domain-containing protein [Breznakia pachnodae]|uniref:DUF3991 domain-containing protein n=1 Tax=Breznakia pachnodae TaxID=265178 RepID=A0ABU0E3U7_9FIRM|nr:DUF3991 and TOPRIM domain-containing protein [Breznakia pachnodae]MDQ0361574.1 hypothetical protein [Breznakia pachnodae]
MAELKFFTRDEIEARSELLKQIKREVSVVELATNLYGLKVLKSKKGSRYLKTMEHRSLVFDLQSNVAYWNGHSGNRALNPIDFMMEYEKISGAAAVGKITQYYRERDSKQIEIFRYERQTDTVQQIKSIVYPDEDKNNDKVISYLTEVRGIKKFVVDRLIDDKMLYQDKNGNCVFIGYDAWDKPTFGCLRGTRSVKFQMDCLGSKKNVGFYYESGKNFKKLALCEAVIDGLSYASLHRTLDANILCASGAGSMLETLCYHLTMRENVNVEEIIFCLDDDPAGRNEQKRIEDWMNKNKPNVNRVQFEFKYVPEGEKRDINNERLYEIKHQEFEMMNEIISKEEEINENELS